MSRFDDSDEEDFPNQGELYAQATKNAVNGKKGQAVLRELEAALLAMPVKRLTTSFLAFEGDVCALGALAVHRKIAKGVSRSDAIDELECRGATASTSVSFAEHELKIVGSLAAEIAYTNDERVDSCATPEERYEEVLHWVRKQITKQGSGRI